MQLMNKLLRESRDFEILLNNLKAKINSNDFILQKKIFNYLLKSFDVEKKYHSEYFEDCLDKYSKFLKSYIEWCESNGLNIGDLVKKLNAKRKYYLIFSLSSGDLNKSSEYLKKYKLRKTRALINFFIKESLNFSPVTTTFTELISRKYFEKNLNYLISNNINFDFYNLFDCEILQKPIDKFEHYEILSILSVYYILNIKLKGVCGVINYKDMFNNNLDDLKCFKLKIKEETSRATFANLAKKNLQYIEKDINFLELNGFLKESDKDKKISI